jgi:hypothetical protein
MALTTGAGLGIVTLDILRDHAPGMTMADRVWGLSAGWTAGLLFAAGIVTLLSVSFRNRIARYLALAIFVAAIGAGGWGVSAGLDLLCVKERASAPIPAAVLGARISIAASAISGWIGLMGVLAVVCMDFSGHKAGTRPQPSQEEK